MGIGGHMLGPRRLRRLSALTGLDLRRAYIRGSQSEGTVWDGDDHTHYAINPRTGEHKPIEDPFHWSSCYHGGLPPS
jgi:hypothetical protein